MKGGPKKPAVLPCSCGHLPAWTGGTHECSGSLICMGHGLCCQNCGTASEWRYTEESAADAWNAGKGLHKAAWKLLEEGME